MPASKPIRLVARFNVALSATGRAACVIVWLVSMLAVAIFAGESAMAMPVLLCLFVGGIVMLLLFQRLGLRGSGGD